MVTGFGRGFSLDGSSCFGVGALSLGSSDEGMDHLAGGPQGRLMGLAMELSSVISNGGGTRLLQRRFPTLQSKDCCEVGLEVVNLMTVGAGGAVASEAVVMAASGTVMLLESAMRGERSEEVWRSSVLNCCIGLEGAVND